MSISIKEKISQFVPTLFKSRNERLLASYQKIVNKINHLEEGLSPLTDSQLQLKSEELKRRQKEGTTLDELLPDAFALVREASKRVLKMRHFDVQLMGGISLHNGKISEMRTGEGKTLVATLPAYLNALSGESVHIVTVNDYLAKRDSDWMGEVFEFLNISVGVVVGDMSAEDRKSAYNCDITYGTNNEFGFDYLRDNMSFELDQRVQRQLNFAIVDEVDSILIDEARTPLVISGPAEDRSDIYRKINQIVPMLTRQENEDGDGHFYVDEKSKQVHLTELGHEKIEHVLEEKGLLLEGESLYGSKNVALMQYVSAAIRANHLFLKNTDYVVKNGEVVIVDEFTGRTMPGRRWSEGLHQAIEAKEKIKIQAENQTLATITYQNYFRQYNKLGGMTGTADTEAYEFQEIYGLEVVVIPTHRPMIRQDNGDLIFLSAKEKFAAIIEDIKEKSQRGQPVLVGTTSIEISEYLSKLLKKDSIKHSVLNAKFHEKEATIIANAGRPGSITVATNMAGRGTDIVLGGSKSALTNEDIDWDTLHERVIEAGGLHIIGTERHESRRIDNQLRGRSGRQGDPGSSRFYLSLEDSLIRIFASEKMTKWMQMAGMESGEAIEHPWVTKAIENAQRKVEGRNFDIRKQLLEYDDVASDQRKHIYDQRKELMETSDILENIRDIRSEVVDLDINNFIPSESYEEEWDIKGLINFIKKNYGMQFDLEDWINAREECDDLLIRDIVKEKLEEEYLKKEKVIGAEILRDFERKIMLQVLDSHWKDHLASMDYLRQGIHLRGFAQKNPKQEYKREAFELFSDMLTRIMGDVIGILSRLQVNNENMLDVTRTSSTKKAPENKSVPSKNKRKEQRKRRKK